MTVVTGESNFAARLPVSKAVERKDAKDLKSFHKPTTSGRNSRKSGFTGTKRLRAPDGKRSRSETPLLKWNMESRVKGESSACVDVEGDDIDRETRRRCRRKNMRNVSSRKLAADFWRLQMPEMGERSGSTKLSGAGLGAQFDYNLNNQVHSSEAGDPLQSPRSVVCTNNGPLYGFSDTAMEGATKWDRNLLRTEDEQQVSAVSALEAELKHARLQIQELEVERQSEKNKLKHFLKKVSEERAEWRSREHEKVWAFIDDTKTNLNHEKKNRQNLEILNSKLLNELSDAKLSAKRYKKNYENERKSRELIEEVCNELANEIEEEKAEVETLKSETMKLTNELEEERRMLQMAEVWREERVQMKLIDAKVALEDKYSQMNKLVVELETILRTTSTNSVVLDMNEVESLRISAESIDIQDCSKAFTMNEHPKSDDFFSIFEDLDFDETKGREIEPCVAQVGGNDGHIEEENGWETVSDVEDQGSSYSSEGSNPSVNKNNQHHNVSGSREMEEDKCKEIPVIEVCSVSNWRLKKISSIAKLWRSGRYNAENNKIMSFDGVRGSKSSVGKVSPD